MNESAFPSVAETAAPQQRVEPSTQRVAESEGESVIFVNVELMSVREPDAVWFPISTMRDCERVEMEDIKEDSKVTVVNDKVLLEMQMSEYEREDGSKNPTLENVESDLISK